MTEQISHLGNVIECLCEIHDDASVPRNVRQKIDIIMQTLRQDSELSTRVNKSLTELDGIANDVNLQSYTRTQIWNIMSILEKL